MASFLSKHGRIQHQKTHKYFENSFAKKINLEAELQVGNCVLLFLNPNHYHFILEQVLDNGIEKFLHRLGTGYTKYFNNKHKRSGYLFRELLNHLI